ncbi:MAG TPA: hypothetical protein VK698_32825 [Kofleriaceae bacterium]|nr:hypothetical protein [Kofleriaceae bacterium]
MTRHGAALTTAAMAALLLGCGARQAGPVSALHDYSAALRAHDYSAAYDMMSESFQAKHSREDFVRMMKESGPEVAQTAQMLGSQHKSVDVTAEFNFGIGDTMRLVQEDGEWRIASNPMAFYSQGTPREALRSFVRAYSLRRWDVMMRFVPTKYRERMSVEKMREQFEGDHREELDSMMNMIQANLDEPITDKGNEARMPYGDRFEVKFVLEEGRWKIQDLD